MGVGEPEEGVLAAADEGQEEPGEGDEEEQVGEEGWVGEGHWNAE
jgi:hypothetical protein